MKTINLFMNKEILKLYNIPICVRDLFFLILNISTLVLLISLTIFYKGYLSTFTIIYTFYSLTFLLSAWSCAIVSKIIDLLVKIKLLTNISTQTLLHILCYILLFLSISFISYTYEYYNSIFYFTQIIIDGILCVLLIHFIVGLISILNKTLNLNKIYYHRGVQEC